MNRYPGSAWHRSQRLKPVSLSELRAAEGVRVIDGLLLKEFREGRWFSLGPASSEDYRMYPVVVD